MRVRKLLLATAALSTSLACGSDTKRVIRSNPKGSVYDKGPPDAGVTGVTDADAAPRDASPAEPE